MKKPFAQGGALRAKVPARRSLSIAARIGIVLRRRVITPNGNVRIEAGDTGRVTRAAGGGAT